MNSALLDVKGLTKDYGTGRRALDAVSFAVTAPQLVGIIGSSGAGKSTLIRCLNRLVVPTAGRVQLHGAEITGLKGRELRALRRQIGMIFQEYNLVERLTVMENLLTGRLGYTSVFNAWRRHFAQADIDHAFELLDVVGLASFANQRADMLSGGQRQRVGIARALMQQPGLLLADEPTSSLDPKTSVDIMTLLREQGRARDIPVLVNMHDVDLARRFADRIIGMAGGQVVYDGDAAGLGHDMLSRIYGGASWIEAA